jgi:hypothetical protein
MLVVLFFPPLFLAQQDDTPGFLLQASMLFVVTPDLYVSSLKQRVCFQTACQSDKLSFIRLSDSPELGPGDPEEPSIWRLIILPSLSAIKSLQNQENVTKEIKGKKRKKSRAKLTNT